MSKEAKICNAPDHMDNCALGACDACSRCRCLDCTQDCIACLTFYKESQDCKEGVE